MKSKLTTVLLILILLVGLSLLLYPSVSDYINKKNSSKAIATYVDTVYNMTEETYEKELAKARKYNEDLASFSGLTSDREKLIERYYDCLNVDGTGMMGYVNIPSIEINLPIYHGTADGVLQIAAGHLDWTSLPIGGDTTHSALSGHRGLPSAKLFSNLDKLSEGDTFAICIMKDTYVYEIDSIVTVLPEGLDVIKIEQGKDYCTLLTCTPYGINTHRLLVRGHRIDTDEKAERTVKIVSEAAVIEPALAATVFALPVLIILIILLFINTDTDKKKNEKRKEVIEKFRK